MVKHRISIALPPTTAHRGSSSGKAGFRKCHGRHSIGLCCGTDSAAPKGSATGRKAVIRASDPGRGDGPAAVWRAGAKG